MVEAFLAHGAAGLQDVFSPEMELVAKHAPLQPGSALTAMV